MKTIALKYCTECGSKRCFPERLFANDDELCDDCYFGLIDAVRERDNKGAEKAEGKNQNAPGGALSSDYS